MSRKKTQKVLIPRGTVNPNEDTLIEIPTSLKEKPMVIASQPHHSFGNTSRPLEKSFTRSTSPIISAGRAGFHSTTIPDPVFSSSMVEMDDMRLPDLDSTEQEEAMMVQEKLRAFQEARRRFLMEATRVANKSIQTSPLSFSNSFQQDDVQGCSSRSRMGRKHHGRRTKSSRSWDDEDDDQCGC
ncbi:hypothetical protein YQE_04239, partial [Dendroctonus ponderosae]